ncbi:ROK family protein [Geminicoccaceae bacterium 1502E]|nr:ROK family protein [Geminicoccaceae bacterium 1502E]
MADSSLAIGVDLGGTKIEVLALDEGGRELLRRRRPTPRGSYERTLEAIAALVHEAERELGRHATVGVGHPGALSPASGRLRNANATWLNGRALDRDLEVVLERPVAAANDADCLALSEATDGAAAGKPVVFAVILGTGVGGGIVAHGRLLQGPNAITGEWGHNPLPWPAAGELPGPACYCGKEGCIETWLSGPGLAAEHRRRTGVEREAHLLADAALAGDPAATTTLELYEDRLARGLATVMNVLDPHAVVLGGGISNIARLYERVPVRIARWLFSDTMRTPLLQARHGDSSGVRGAAWLGRAAARERG